MRILALALMCILNPRSGEELHDFHVSRARIEYAEATQEWQITLHVFIDDLEEALEVKGKEALYLGTEKEATPADAYVEKYLRNTFRLYDGTTELTWEWIGKETSDDLTAFWIYLYLPGAPPSASLTVENKLLLDLYDDQQNMVQVRGAGDKLRNFLFHRDYWKEEINFNH